MFLRQHIYSNTVRVPSRSFSSPPGSQGPLSPEGCSNWSPKRRHDSGQSVEESRKKTRLTEPSTSVVVGDSHLSNQDGVSLCLGHGTTVFSSPPYSPASSQSPPTQGEPIAHHLLEEQCGVTEGLLSPPSGSPHYSPPSTHSSRVVDPEPSATYTSTLMLQSYNHEAFPTSSFGVSSPTTPGPQPVYPFSDCPSDSCLVPDYQPLAEVFESQADCVLHPEDFSLLPMAPMDLGGSDAPQELPPTSHNAPPPGPEAPPTAHPNLHYSEHEHEQVEISLLARQISSLASSFNTYCSQGPAPGHVSPHHQGAALGWSQHAPPLYLPAATSGSETVLDESTIDCILKDLDGMLGRVEGWGQPEAGQLSRRHLARTHDLSLAALVDGLPAEEFGSPSHTTADPRTVRSECQDHNAGLHQLHPYTHCSMPQGNHDYCQHCFCTTKGRSC